ncbi:MAG: multicopper oxidase domain-containing protein [Flavobacteriales bacterium]|nr:Multicopper oxidase mco [Flavobacteriales bacterium]MCC6577518.1 multicopper oxidase domain-containing protein [Flavobacteriales bacterium]NUQ16803.1 multicopper oxidase domain-containing protein [Flavobacteriales bacterium]
MRKLLLTGTTLLVVGATSGQNPLAVPPLMTADTFHLVVAPSTKEFYPGWVTETYGINLPYLGYALELQQGDTARFKVYNQLNEITTMHWNGLEVPPVFDGSPPREIAPGGTWDVKYKVLDKASMYTYHPHTMDLIGQQVGKGAAGLLIVRDAEEAALDLPRQWGVDDFPVVVQDKRFNPSGQFINAPLGDSILVNGTARPFVECPAQVVRLRLANASTARYYRFGFEDGTVFQVIGGENGLLAAPAPMGRLTLSSGERAELLLDLTGMEGDSLLLMSYGSELPQSVPGSGNILWEGSALNGADFPVLRIRVTAPTANPVTTIPATLANVQPYPESSATVSRTKVIEGMGMVGDVGMFTINGAEWDMNVINDTVMLGATEIWEFVNLSNIAHPITMHGGAFYVLDRDGVPPAPWEAGPKSVVNVDVGDTVRIIMRFAVYATDGWPLMYHCHNLAHINMMMWQFIVVDPNVGLPALDAARIEVFPVPGDRITWRAPSPVAALRVLDLGGREVLHASGRGHTTGDLDLTSLPAGSYVLELQGLGTRTRTMVMRP